MSPLWLLLGVLVVLGLMCWHDWAVYMDERDEIRRKYGDLSRQLEEAMDAMDLSTAERVRARRFLQKWGDPPLIR